MNEKHEMSIKFNGLDQDESKDRVLQYLETYPDTDLQAMQQSIISGCHPWGVHDAYLFARNISGADVDGLQKVILERGDGWDAFRFARDINGADIDALQRVVIQHGIALNAYHFAISVTGSDIAAMQSVVVEHGSGNEAYWFAKDVKGADIAALQAVVIRRKSVQSAYNFAMNIPSADIRTLQNVITRHGTADAMYRFAENVKGADTVSQCMLNLWDAHSVDRLNSLLDGVSKVDFEAFQWRIFLRRDAMESYAFATSINVELHDTVINILQQNIIDQHDVRFAYLFARDIIKADSSALYEVVAKYGSCDDRHRFRQNVKDKERYYTQQSVLEYGSDVEAYAYARDNTGADIAALQSIVIQGGDYQLIYAFAKDVHPQQMTPIHTAFKTLTKDIQMSDALMDMRKEMIALHLEADDWATLICEAIAPQSGPKRNAGKVGVCSA